MSDTINAGGQEIETFVWKGQMRYRCPGHWESGAKCQFDCSDLAELVSHMKSPHLRAAPIMGAPSAASVPTSVEETEKAAPEFRSAKFAESVTEE